MTKIGSVIEQVMRGWGESIPEDKFNLGIALFKDLMEGNIKKDEFLKQCTYLMLSCGFDELRPLNLPDRPLVLMSHDNLPSEAQERTKSDFWQKYEVRKYMDEKFHAIQVTLGNKKWLRENLNRLESYKDTPNIEKIRWRLQEFKDWEEKNWEDIRYLYKT